MGAADLRLHLRGRDRKDRSRGEGENAHLLVPEANYGLSPSELSERLVRLTGKIAEALPLRALAMAGGYTSSVIAGRLGFESLKFESRLGAGVCRTHASNSTRDGVLLFLDGGQGGSSGI